MEELGNPPPSPEVGFLFASFWLCDTLVGIGGTEYEIEILHRIADDVMVIVSQRPEKADNEQYNIDLFTDMYTITRSRHSGHNYDSIGISNNS